jgi:transposase
MAEVRKQYTREFKIEAVRLLETSGKGVSEIERELGIGKSNPGRWKLKYGSEGQQATSGADGRTPERERIRKLERENEILRQERDILHLPWRAVPGKKAVAIFSQPKL